MIPSLREGSAHEPPILVRRETEMKLPAEFLELNLQFYQDILKDASREDEIIDTVLPSHER
jgi:hypothetical protein